MSLVTDATTVPDNSKRRQWGRKAHANLAFPPPYVSFRYKGNCCHELVCYAAAAPSVELIVCNLFIYLF